MSVRVSITAARPHSSAASPHPAQFFSASISALAASRCSRSCVRARLASQEVGAVQILHWQPCEFPRPDRRDASLQGITPSSLPSRLVTTLPTEFLFSIQAYTFSLRDSIANDNIVDILVRLIPIRLLAHAVSPSVTSATSTSSPARDQQVVLLRQLPAQWVVAAQQ